MNVWIWGPPLWDTLHNASFLCDRYGLSMKPMAYAMRQLLPCRYCRDSYLGFYETLGPPTTGYAAKWTYDMHNLVNQKLARQKIQKLMDEKQITDKCAKGLLEEPLAIATVPTFEAVQKRFMVNRDEPLQWRNMSTVLLAFVMGLQLLDRDLRNFDDDGILLEQHAQFVCFVEQLRDLVALSKQSNAKNIGMFLDKFLKALQARETLSALRGLVEKAKYDAVLGTNGPLKSANDASKYMQAGACFSGTCV